MGQTDRNLLAACYLKALHFSEYCQYVFEVLHLYNILFFIYIIVYLILLFFFINLSIYLSIVIPDNLISCYNLNFTAYNFDFKKVPQYQNLQFMLKALNTSCFVLFN